MDRKESTPTNLRYFPLWEVLNLIEDTSLTTISAFGFLDDVLNGCVRVFTKGPDGCYTPIELATIALRLKAGELRGNALNVFQIPEDDLRKYLSDISGVEPSRSLEQVEKWASITRTVGKRVVSSRRSPWHRAGAIEPVQKRIRPRRPAQTSNTEARNSRLRSLAVELIKEDRDRFEKPSGRPDKTKLRQHILTLKRKNDPRLASVPGALTADIVRKALTGLESPSDDVGV